MATEVYFAGMPQRRLSSSDNLALKNLVNRIGQIRYLQPDRRPNLDWKMFYAPTWGDAWHLAQKELDNIDMRQGEENKPYLQNISRLIAVQDCEIFGDDFISNVAWAACYTAQEAIRSLVANWEWNRKLFDKREYMVEEDLVPNRPGGLTKEVTLTISNLLVDLSNETLSLINETARDSAIESVGEDAWLLARLLLTKPNPFFHREGHIARVEERLKVWEKGYALAGDCCGELYVYCKGRP